MPNFRSLATAPAMLAVLSMTAAPAVAAELPRMQPVSAGWAELDPVYDATKAETLEHRRYHRYRYRRGPDAGDVIAGVLIIGAIAAAADRASKRDRDRDYPDRDYRDRDYRERYYRDRDYRDYRDDARWRDGRGIDRAVNMCIARVERDTRVETVDRVDRTARGWQVAGTIFNGDGFTCMIDEDGRISDVDYGQRGASYERDDDDRYDDDYAVAPENDRQWEDDRYAEERERLERGATADAGDARTAYPGGPIEGDDDGEVDGDLEAEDGYTTI
ncbi:hypothetical protein K3165_02750 [Qipengyuania sp. 1XM1-15A]|uniref:hypothetical protein n=1 Tax=Qipengyuania xiamenensis TaxID=2867237 RepID=UPI001C87930C|nr:hypothetical protein [Qipengyuania xiamenensis]MBX7531841.1 hypothetical protein [Qipengyuania xiamenensis]